MNLNKHPYLLIGNENLKGKADKCSFLWKPILARAKKDLFEHTILPDDFNGWLWEDLDRTKERILRGCITCKITGDPKYFNAMKKQLWCLIDQWPWIEKFHHEEVKLEADLRTGIIMFTLGLVYDWMYDYFTSDERAKIKNAITIRGFDMLKKDIENDAFYLTSYGNNWLAVMLGGYAVASLAVYNESAYAREIVELAIERTQIMAEHVGNDGAWEEGPFYWGGIAFLIMFFNILDSLPGQDKSYLEKDALLRACMFPLYMNMPGGGRANFSDAHYYQDHNAAYLFSIMGKIDNNPYYQWAFKQYREVAKESKSELFKIDIKDFRPMEETYQFLAYDESLIPEYPEKLPLYKVFQGDTYGFVASRGGFGRYDDSLVLCANGGTNGTNHHQLDIGQVIMTHKQHNYISDPGYGRAFYLSDKTRVDRQNYFAKSSMGHNIITINGENQTDTPDARGLIKTLNTDSSIHKFTIEMNSAYCNCSKAQRTIERRVSQDIVSVTDEFSLSDKLPTRLAWFYKGSAIVTDKDTIVISSSSGFCTVKIESDSNFSISLESYSEEGMLDRNHNIIKPNKYNYICINIEPTIDLNIESIFVFV